MKYILIFVVVAVILIFVFKDKLNLGKPQPAEKTPDKKPTNNPVQPQGTKFPLQKGSVSPLVGELQKFLKVGVDNVWGNQTEQALKNVGLPTVYASEKEVRAALASFALMRGAFSK